MLKRENLIEAMEHSDAMLPEIPGHIKYVRLPGVLLCESNTNDPNANKALLAKFTDADADAGIDRAVAHFRALNKCFSWIVGPSTTPRDLGERLLRHGFEVLFAADGLHLPDLNPDIEINPSVRVVELSHDSLEPAVPIVAVGFGSTEEDSRSFHETIRLSGSQVNTHVYAAYLDGVERAVACAYVTYFPDKPIALLCGGATLPEYRGKGIYRTLTAYRLDEIRRAGIESVILLADQRTSSPICLRNGFVKICDFQFYLWKPA